MTLSTADLTTNDDGGVAGKKKGPRADRPKRRTFSAEYKLAIVAEYEQATAPGAKGALLRREGLYHSHILDWTRARDAGLSKTLSPKRPGPKPAKSESERRAEKLEADNQRLVAELAKAKQANEVLGKLAEFLELLSNNSGNDTKQTP
ncbi:transposase [Nocardia sp. NPDC058666]|uniref:transposase n=1 Tax=Nocardia sp. NPDC058666 TaxID=3346587 RepID=UPI0036562670